MIVEVRDLKFRYDDGTEALRGIDFSMAPGETIAFFGANGSGKTTFALHLNGLLRGEGYISVAGLEMADANLQRIRQKVGLVLQDSDNQLFMPTVLEDVAFGPLAAGVEVKEAERRAKAALERVEMLHKSSKAPYHLSAGEKKRVAIAGILAGDPELLILDEPTTFLDPPGQRSLHTLLAALPQAKILITHDIPFAASLTDQAVFFDQGRIAAKGNLRDIVERFNWQALPTS